jgi:hypothetical protein
MFLDFLADKIKGLTVACNWTAHPHALEVNLTQWAETVPFPPRKGKILQLHPGSPCSKVQWQGVVAGSSDRSPPQLIGGGDITADTPAVIEVWMQEDY